MFLFVGRSLFLIPLKFHHADLVLSRSRGMARKRSILASAKQVTTPGEGHGDVGNGEGDKFVCMGLTLARHNG